MGPKRVLSGMRPTGRLHLGHLHGALANWLSLSHEYECFFFSADWHALTSDYADTSRIAENTREMVIDWLSAGLDPDRCTIFVQSQVKEHAELYLILTMYTPLPWATGCPTFKEQQEQIADKDLNTLGFLGYPILQAADILIYKAHFVPVGIDQVPHIEIARDVARRFNNFFGEVLVQPAPKLTEVPKIPGTDGRKMSKSYGNTINLTDSADEVRQKVSTMMTDPARQRRTDPGDPSICPVYTLWKAYDTEENLEWVRTGCTTAGIGCLQCKKPLIERINAQLGPIQARRRDLESDPAMLDRIIATGNDNARETASATMTAVRSALGL
ncbi:MAG: tryptophan--tRNA ligase [Deltaproteobacteria bacterium]|nr:tryptophan--tRNA ligase [Deltaproteobacteria bacterium]